MDVYTSKLLIRDRVVLERRLLMTKPVSSCLTCLELKGGLVWLIYGPCPGVELEV